MGEMADWIIGNGMMPPDDFDDERQAYCSACEGTGSRRTAKGSVYECPRCEGSGHGSQPTLKQQEESK